MLSSQQKFWNGYARFVQKPVIALIGHQPTVRRIADLSAAITLKTPGDLTLTEKHLGLGTDSVRTTVCQIGPTPTGGSMLYLHGGAFMIGNLRGYRHLVSELGKAANQIGHFLHYGLAPEHRFPTALDQATFAFEALCAAPDAGPISLVGDSAGGNLVFALLHRICSRGLQKPVAVAAIAPISDLRLTNASLETNVGSDHLVPMRWIVRGKDAYLGGHDPSDPEVSPVLGTFVGAPPCLLHVDETEILVDDSKALANRLRDQGVTTEVPKFKGRTHVWHLNVGRCPEADDSVQEIGAFIRKQVARRSRTFGLLELMLFVSSRSSRSMRGRHNSSHWVVRCECLLRPQSRHSSKLQKTTAMRTKLQFAVLIAGETRGPKRPF